MNKKYGICSAGRDGLFYVVLFPPVGSNHPQKIIGLPTTRPVAETTADVLNQQAELAAVYAGRPLE